jgi:transcriptional regulator with XRE-family HTH domain
MGMNRSYVGMIERRENSPTVATLERIAKALGIEPRG